jgi:predicted membrane-bound mannosyltransferase
MTPSHPFALFGRRAALLVLVLTFLALGLRLYRLSNQSFWVDEVYTVFTAQVPFVQVDSYSTKVSNSLPTYFWILGLILPEGHSDIEWVARLPSALAGALSVPVFIGVVYCWRRHTGAALLAGLLLAVNPLHIWYSQEARAYALMLFFGLLAILFLELALFSGQSDWLTFYLFSALIAVALHYSALVFPGLCIVWHVLHLFRQGIPVVRVIKQLLVHLPMIGIGVLMLMFIKLNPPAEGYRPAGSVFQFGYTFMTFLGGYSFGPSLTEIQNSGPLPAVARSWLQVVVLLVVLAPIVLACKLNWRKLVSTRETALLAAGIGIVTACSMVSGFAYNVRYVLPSLFGFLALIAAFAISLPDRPRLVRLITVAVLAVAIWADAQWFYSPRYRKPDARAVAKWLVDNKDHVKSWTVLPAYLKLPLYWYLFELHQDVLKQALTPTGARTTSFPPVPDVLILERRDQLDQPDKMISSYRLAAGKVQTNRSFAGFELYLSDPPYSAGR